jgi:hypothetical protein
MAGIAGVKTPRRLQSNGQRWSPLKRGCCITLAAGALPDPQGQSKAPSAAAQVWAEYRHVIFERMSAIDAAVIGLREANLTEEVRQKAVLESHRLAGSLGMFGLMEGTRISREIERMVCDQTSLGPGTLPELSELAASLRQILEKGIA